MAEEGTRGIRPRQFRTMFGGLLVVVVLFGGAAGSTGCKSSSAALETPRGVQQPTSSSFSPMMQAYREAHPALIDGPLVPRPRSTDEILADIRAVLDAGEDIWLPDYLPEGFVLAAPYNGDGSGSAYPNPYAVGGAYSVTYTDGEGYVMVMKNSQDDLSQGNWTPLEETLAGRHLRLQLNPDVTLVATVDDGKEILLVAGAGFAGDHLPAELTLVAVSLSLHQSTE